ncbi:MAG: pyrrolo-quinoline quinone, partial [Thermoguttaceae bacterium]
MPLRRLPAFLLLLVAVIPLALRAENWPQWRGPEGNGVTHESGLPVAWNEGSGIVWKCDLPQW